MEDLDRDELKEIIKECIQEIDEDDRTIEVIDPEILLMELDEILYDVNIVLNEL